MSDTVITIEQVSKRYHLGSIRHDTLRDRLAHGLGRLRRAQPTSDETEFWALRDVSFEVRRGEVLGIIGRNGAGKSTLLKVLSRITEPTMGRVRLRGRVASLLEVGTGFHPELSGRENIFLNGAILGMSRAEIQNKFDEIVAFAEVERFLDTPVKHYSSGMYVRLAFAVAAHLEPEILIIDEVLAVGDLAFQRKCLGKMQEVSRSDGRTVLFVSHNLPSVRQLCRRAVIMDAGRVTANGPCHQVLNAYENSFIQRSEERARRDQQHDLGATTTGVRIETLDGQSIATVPLGTSWRIRVTIAITRSLPQFVVGVGLKLNDGTPVQTAWNPPADVSPGNYEATFVQDRVVLGIGSYAVLVGLASQNRSIEQIEATHVEVSSENAVGFFPVSAGVGAVLNSMTTELRRLA